LFGVQEMDKIIGISELRNSISSIIKKVYQGSRYIIIQRSKPSAVLLSPEEVETLEVMADKDLLEDIKKAKEDILKDEFISYEDFFGKKLPDKSK
jgi:prevent-host-death family protein